MVISVHGSLAANRIASLFCRRVVVGGSFTHLSARCEPQRHVQTEREGNSSQQFRRHPSQSPARYRPPDPPVSSTCLPPFTPPQSWRLSLLSCGQSAFSLIFILLCGALFGASVSLGSGRLHSPFLSKPWCEGEQASSCQRQASPVPAGSASPVSAAGVILHTFHTYAPWSLTTF